MGFTGFLVFPCIRHGLICTPEFRTRREHYSKESETELTKEILCKVRVLYFFSLFGEGGGRQTGVFTAHSLIG